MLSREPYCPSL